MCRLFGFRSVIPSQVHSSLVAAENALSHQSNEHPDGWGVAYFVDGSPQLTRSPATALGDQLFHRLSGVVSSETVVAHVRKATRGEISVLNCHPFQHGRWVFAHNGDVPRFEEYRGKMLDHVSPRLRRFILGDTDSETIFFMLLTELETYGPLSGQYQAEDVVRAVKATTRLVQGICQVAQGEALFLTVMVTDGQVMVASHGGKQLFLSTYKKRCGERERCPSLSAECEAPTKTGTVNHLIVSSERLQGENVWEPLSEGDIVGVDGKMRLIRTHMDRTELQVLQ